MKIGIISDTHDDLDSLRSAIRIFKRERISLVIHAGDFVFPGVVDELKNLKDVLPEVRVIGVLGNNDGEKLMLSKKFIEIGGELKAEFDDRDIQALGLEFIMEQAKISGRPLFGVEFMMSLFTVIHTSGVMKQLR